MARAPKFYIHGGNKWLELDNDGHVESWGLAKFAFMKHGKLNILNPKTILSALRTLQAGQRSCIKDGARVPTRNARVPTRRTHSRYKKLKAKLTTNCDVGIQTTPQSSPMNTVRPVINTSSTESTPRKKNTEVNTNITQNDSKSRKENEDVIQENSRRDNANCNFYKRKRVNSGDSLVWVVLPKNVSRNKNKLNYKGAEFVNNDMLDRYEVQTGNESSPLNIDSSESSQVEIVKRTKSNSKFSSLKHDKLKKKARRLKREIIGKKADNKNIETSECTNDSSQSNTSRNSLLKELIITEEDKQAVRNYLIHKEPNFDLNKFDEDFEYQSQFFYKINPLVSLVRCPKIAQMLREEHEKMSIEDFASRLGLTPISRKPVPKRYKMRERKTEQKDETDNETDKENYMNVKNKQKSHNTYKMRSNTSNKNVESETDSEIEEATMYKRSDKKNNCYETIQTAKKSDGKRGSNTQKTGAQNEVSSKAKKIQGTDDSSAEENARKVERILRNKTRMNRNLLKEKDVQRGLSKMEINTKYSDTESDSEVNIRRNNSKNVIAKHGKKLHINDSSSDFEIKKIMGQETSDTNMESNYESTEDSTEKIMKNKITIEKLKNSDINKKIRHSRSRLRHNRKGPEQKQKTAPDMEIKLRSHLSHNRIDAEEKQKTTPYKKLESRSRLRLSRTDLEEAQKTAIDKEVESRSRLRNIRTNPEKTQNTASDKVIGSRSHLRHNRQDKNDEQNTTVDKEDSRFLLRQNRKDQNGKRKITTDKSITSSEAKAKNNNRKMKASENQTNKNADSTTDTSEDLETPKGKQLRKPNLNNNNNILTKQNKNNFKDLTELITEISKNRGTNENKTQTSNGITESKKHGKSNVEHNVDASNTNTNANNKQFENPHKMPSNISSDILLSSDNETFARPTIKEIRSLAIEPVENYKRPASSASVARQQYSNSEDQAIVTWVSRGARAQRVNGNALWKDFENEFYEVTGQHRSWHSLRNRYLRSILPRLPRLAVDHSTITRLRAAAASGELKSRKLPPPPPKAPTDGSEGRSTRDSSARPETPNKHKERYTKKQPSSKDGRSSTKTLRREERELNQNERIKTKKKLFNPNSMINL